jgi:hypothetical protein
LYQPSFLDPVSESSWRASYDQQSVNSSTDLPFDMEISLKGWIESSRDGIVAQQSKILRPVQIDITTFNSKMIVRENKKTIQ